MPLSGEEKSKIIKENDFLHRRLKGMLVLRNHYMMTDLPFNSILITFSINHLVV